MGSLAPTRAELLPPRKRFRDSYSSEASIEEDTEIDPIETEVDIELGIGDGDDVRDHVKIDPRDVGIDLMSAPIVEEEIVEPAGEDSFDSYDTKDGIVRSFEVILIDLNDVVRDFYHHMSEVRIDRIVEIETVQRRLEADQLMARRQRVSMIKRIDSLRLENLKVYAMLDIERDHVNNLRLYMSLSHEEFHQVCRDRDDSRERLTRNEDLKDGTELSNLSVKNKWTWLTYTQRFQELTMMCTKMVPEEEDRVEKFIRGLPDNIQGNVIAAEPTRLQDVVSNCQQLDGSKVERLSCKGRREQEEIEQQL
ncbi:hypothetical protein Tco_1353290 [Tanacetum coccineum]